MAIVLVTGQNATTDFSSTTTTTVTLPNNPTVGNFVVVLISMGASVAQTVTVKDSNNNTYTATSKTPFRNSTTAQQVGVYYLANAPANASKTINITISPGNAGDVWALEFSGVATSSPFENDATSNNASSSTIVLPTYTTLNAGDLLVSTAGSNGTISAATSPWTAAGTLPTTQGEGAEYFIQTSAGAQAVAYSQSVNGTNVCIIAAFKAAAAATATIVEQSFFDVVPKKKLGYEFVQGPFAGVSPALSTTFATSSFFVDQVKLKRPIIDMPDNPPGKSPALASPYVQAAFFDPTRLKQPIINVPDKFQGTAPALSGTFATSPFFDLIRLNQPIINTSDITPAEPIKLAGERWFELVQLKRPAVDNLPVLIPPAVVLTATIVEQAFFEAVSLKKPSEFMQGPFAGTSPALTNPYVTQAFFDAIGLKQPIIDKPSDMTPLVAVVNFSAANWFDAVKLLKLPERFTELYPQRFWTPESYDAWFDQIKLLKIPERMQEAFGFPFPPPILGTSAFFDTVRIKQPPPNFDFLQATAQLNTVQNALTDWFATVKLKQPVVETPLVVYFPAQVIPTFTAEYEVMFFANVGKLMGH